MKLRTLAILATIAAALVVVFYASTAALAPNLNGLKIDYPFTTDGCSGSTMRIMSIMHRRDLPWRDCCVNHDYVYWAGGTYFARQMADQTLRACVSEKGYHFTARLMWVGVTIGGSPYWPTSYRWGYGYKWPTGYYEQ